VHLKKYSENPSRYREKICYILAPMKTSESIEAHMSAAVESISQRNQATLPGFHKFFLISVFDRLYRLAKASGFCLYFYAFRATSGAHFGKLNELKIFNTTAMRIV